jgi:hypothetical protein
MNEECENRSRFTQLTSEDSTRILTLSLDEKLSQIIPRDEEASWDKTPDERREVYQEIAQTIDGLEVREDTFDDLIETIVRCESFIEMFKLRYDFCKRHGLSELQEKSELLGESILGEVVDLFPRAEPILERLLKHPPLRFEWLEDQFLINVAGLTSLDVLLLQREKGFDSEEQMLRIDRLINDFILIGGGAVHPWASKKEEDELAKAIKIVITEWRFPKERLKGKVQEMIDDLLLTVPKEDYLMLSGIASVMERISLLVELEETDWQALRERDLAFLLSRNYEKDRYFLPNFLYDAALNLASLAKVNPEGVADECLSLFEGRNKRKEILWKWRIIEELAPVDKQTVFKRNLLKGIWARRFEEPLSEEVLELYREEPLSKETLELIRDLAVECGEDDLAEEVKKWQETEELPHWSTFVEVAKEVLQKNEA